MYRTCCLSDLQEYARHAENYFRNNERTGQISVPTTEGEESVYFQTQQSGDRGQRHREVNEDAQVEDAFSTTETPAASVENQVSGLEGQNC